MIEMALVLALVAGQSDQSSAIARDLEQFEQQLAATWKSGDCDAWGGMLAADWSVIHITGNVITKAEALKMCRDPRPPIDTLDIDEVSVRSFGDAAVVTGRTTVKGGGANPETLRLRFTDFFVRRDGRWRVVASHATRIAP